MDNLEKYTTGNKFFITLLLSLLVAALLGSLLGCFKTKKEGYYYKVGKAHTFMPGWISNPADSVLNCEACDKKKNCYSY